MKKITYRVGVFAVGVFVAGLPLKAAEQEKELVATAVFSETFDGYHREMMADGKFKPESYVLADGGLAPGTTRDDSQRQTSIFSIVGPLQTLLAKDNYVIAYDPEGADFLLAAVWGRTLPSVKINYDTRVAVAGQTKAVLGDLSTDRESSVSAYAAYEYQAREYENAMLQVHMENQMRDLQNGQNAALLGFERDIEQNDDIRRLFLKTSRYNELVTEIEQPRYFVILTAYALPLPKDLKEQKRLWSTRVSIRAAGNSFGESLRQMLASASRYAGRDSRKLIRTYEGKVTMDDFEVIGIEPESGSPQPTQSEADE